MAEEQQEEEEVVVEGKADAQIDHPLATTVATGAREHIRRGDGTARKTKRLLRTEGATTAMAVALLHRSPSLLQVTRVADLLAIPATAVTIVIAVTTATTETAATAVPTQHSLPVAEATSEMTASQTGTRITALFLAATVLPHDPQMQTMAEDQDPTRIKTMGASIPSPPWLIFRRAREAVCEARPAPHLALRLTTLPAADRMRGSPTITALLAPMVTRRRPLEDKAPTDILLRARHPLAVAAVSSRLTAKA